MEKMKATQLLHDDGQSLWLDNITRGLLNSGTLRWYIDELSVTGLTSNPTIFDHAIRNSFDYDAEIVEGIRKGKSGEELSSIWRWKTLRALPTCSVRSMTRPTAWMVGCRSRSHPFWLTKNQALLPQRSSCLPVAMGFQAIGWMAGIATLG
jgi:hypothetical protein